MIDKWFVNDINEVLGQQGRVVVTDAKGEGKFLLDFLPQTIVLQEVGDTELDEIKAKYEAETDATEKANWRTKYEYLLGLETRTKQDIESNNNDIENSEKYN